MIKRLLIVLIFLNITSCGFVPINNISNNKDISIQNIKIISGDRKLNMDLQRTLKRYQKNISEKSFNIYINSNYEKKTISKNTTGAATKYQLKATVNFEIFYNGIKNNAVFIETFNIDHSSDDFENRNYENTVKENFANSISEKLIFKMLSLL